MTKRIISCRECGEPVAIVSQDKKRHCSKLCLDRWNNRRRRRGEKLYDLFMILRYERPTAKAEDVFTILCRMLAEFREEDKTAGREQSFYPMAELREKVMPFAQVTSKIR